MIRGGEETQMMKNVQSARWEEKLWNSDDCWLGRRTEAWCEWEKFKRTQGSAWNHNAEGML